MIAETGLFLVVLAMMVAAAQAVLPLIGASRRDRNLMSFASAAALTQVATLLSAFILLAYAFYVSDFSMLIVANHSNTSMPLAFRVTAAWGNHEGSLLLWVLILAIFGAALAAFGRGMPQTLKARVLAVQGAIAFGFLALMIFTSNPFARMHPAPADGMELNPLLQDIGLVIHPPFLYLGYVGFSIVFSFAVGALLEGRVDAVWARYVRPWVLLAWIFLTIGITLGSYWAYYELGWGGWWFWDPVENASFMPWLVGTALLHSAIVVERRQALIVWTIMLAIVTFSLSLIGTFLVRSGVITSVHAFATDPARGIGVLLLLCIFTGGALTLFAARAKSFGPSVPFTVVSRESGLILNNILLVTAAATVFLGTFYPLFVELLSEDRISVGPPYFNRTFGPLMLVLMAALSVGAMLRWKRDSLAEGTRRLSAPFGLSVAFTLALTLWLGLSGLDTALGLGLALWLVLGACWMLAARMQLSRGNIGRSAELARNTPAAVYGMALAHAGLGLMLAGIVSVSTWQEERIVSIPVGQTVSLGGYDVTLEGVTTGARENFRYEQGVLSVRRGGAEVDIVRAERRAYPVSGNVTTEAGILTLGLTNLYAAMGGPAGGGEWVVRVYYHPLVLLIWFGPAAMALGGLMSLSDRRVRFGAARRSAVTTVAAQ